MPCRSPRRDARESTETRGSRRLTAPQLLALAVCYQCVALVSFAPVSDYAHLGSHIASGDPALLAWTFGWVSHAVLSGEPLFDANIFYPTHGSLAYAEHHLGTALWGVPLFGVTGNAVLTYHVLRLVAPALNALAAHVWLHRVTRDHRAAALGALVYGLAAPRVIYGGHVPQHWTFCLPLLLVALDAWIENPTWRRATLVFALGVGQVFTTSYVAVMTALACGIFVAAWQLHSWRTGRLDAGRVGRLVLQGGVIACAGAALAFPLLKPYAVLDELAAPGLAANYSLTLGAFVRPLTGSLAATLWGCVGASSAPIGAEQNQFLGWIAIALAVAGAADAIRRGGEARRWAAFLIVLCGAGIALSLGPAARGGFAPFDLVTRVPGLRLFRVPARFTFLVLTGLSGLVAFGGLAVCRWWPRRAAVVALAIGGAMLVEWTLPDSRLPWQWDATPPRIYDALAGLEPGALVSLPCYRRTTDAARESEYMVYSTHHWRPIVNGYGRHDPIGSHPVVGAVTAFPGPNSAIRMRALGIRFVILHSARYADGAEAVLGEARASTDFEVVAREGHDYLFRVRPGP